MTPTPTPTSNSILEFLNHEQRCLHTTNTTDTARSMASQTSIAELNHDGGHYARTLGNWNDVVNEESDNNAADDDHDDDVNDDTIGDGDGDGDELDIESIFEEIQRLSGGNSRSGGGDGAMPERSLDEILREAEALIVQQEEANAAAVAAEAANKSALRRQLARIATTTAPTICHDADATAESVSFVTNNTTRSSMHVCSHMFLFMIIVHMCFWILVICFVKIYNIL